MLHQLQGLVDGGGVGDVLHIQDLIHSHTHDGHGHPVHTGELPADGVLGDILVQLGGVVIDPLYQTGDVGPLGLVGEFGIQGLLLPDEGEGLAVEGLVQQLPGGLPGEAQFKGQVDGDLSGGGSGHDGFLHSGMMSR